MPKFTDIDLTEDPNLIPPIPGTEQPEPSLFDTDLAQKINEYDPFVAAGQAMGMGPIAQEPMTEIDVTEDPRIQPQDPAADGPTKADKLAAARVMLDSEKQSEQPQYVDRESGSTHTTSTSTEKSEEAAAAERGIAQAQADAQAASQKEMQAVEESARVNAEMTMADQKVIQEVENARAQAIQDNSYELQGKLAEIDAKVAELANYKPETFWGSKTTSDKIAAGLSVGLGAYGQALLGSGQNIGQVLLERQMNEFDNNEKMKYQRQVAEIQGMRSSLETKQKLFDNAEDMYDAKKLAARAQVQGQFAKASAMAKTPQVQAAIMQRQAKVDMDASKIMAEIAQKREAKISTTIDKKIYERVKLTPGMGVDGKPRNLTEGQTKAKVAYSSVAGANQVLKGADLAKVASDPNFIQYLKDKQSDNALRDFPAVGKFAAGGMNAAFGTSEENLANRNPELARVNSAMNAWTQGVTRYKTGAVIGPEEVAEERKVYFPVPGDTPDIIADKARIREELEQAMREAGGI